MRACSDAMPSRPRSALQRRAFWPSRCRALQHGNQIPDSMFPSVQILQGILIKFQFPSFRVSGAPPWVRRGTPKTRFHVSKCADSRILLCKFQIPSFRVSKAPLWVRGGTPISKFLVSWWADSRILLRKFQIPRFRVCRFQDTLCKFQIPSFRVSEAPSWVRSGGTPKFQIPSFRVSEEHPSWVLAQGTPKFQFPSFRVSEAPSSVQGRWNPKFQIPSFRVSEDPKEDPSWVAGRSKRDPQIPRSKFPSVIPSAHRNVGSTDSRIQSAVSISAPVLSCSRSELGRGFEVKSPIGRRSSRDQSDRVKPRSLIVLRPPCPTPRAR